ncbi:hypothetical protein [Rhizohabitans arisaemae]|uniref:hypothetical protein n=1 Tax=Rhizohabitans arisaemae TaxID=2720610 RepID=UPI0024B12EEA|nr:hypothetical protein [Rhizohabitans arisaemae]
MNDAPSLAGYRVITADEAEECFGVGSDVRYPYQDFAEEQEIRLYEGGLRVAGKLEREGDDDWSPYNVIVDGDLTAGGDIEWWDSAGGNFLLVTGNARVRSVVLSGCPDVVVRGDLTASGGIQGSWGDDGGCLTVRGRTRAEFIMSTKHFTMTFARRPEALLIGDDFILADPSDRACPPDFSTGDLAAVVLPELLGNGDRPDERAIGAALSAGRPVLRPGVGPARLAARHE